MSDNKEIIILLLSVLNNSASSELDIKFGGILRKTWIWIKFNKLSI